MPQQHTQFPPSGRVAGDAVTDYLQGPDGGRAAVAANADDSGLLAAADRDHFEREIAAIERATAALRRAEPELESWTDMPAPTMQKPRPVWLLIGLLWLSTALATIGAAFAISALVG
jgi:hypothetical protein